MSCGFTGHCGCGTLRFECAVLPLAMYQCHCASCRRAGDAAAVSIVVVPSVAVTIIGPVRYYSVTEDNTDHANHGICPDCGTALFAVNKDNPDVLIIRAAVIDDTVIFDPVADIWTINACGLNNMDRQIPKVFRSPPVLEREGVHQL